MHVFNGSSFLQTPPLLQKHPLDPMVPSMKPQQSALSVQASPKKDLLFTTQSKMLMVGRMVGDTEGVEVGVEVGEALGRRLVRHLGMRLVKPRELPRG